MKPVIRLLLLSLLLALAPRALADMPQLRGYDPAAEEKYIYVTFGNYFSDGYGGYGPVLWRVLGPGIPGEGDVSTDGVGENDNVMKAANKDIITEENADVFCLMTEYIIDFHLYNEVRDTRETPALEYRESELYRFITDTRRERGADGRPVGLLGWLFTEDERAVLMDMPERGLVSPPSRKGELFRRDYGFMNEDFRECLRRQATGTHYAFDQGLKYIVDSWSWYWTTDRRRVGFRWIVGDNGHTSVAGADREGGVRLVCYPHTAQLECLGGSGTLEDPYRLVTKSAYRRAAKAAAHTAVSASARDFVRQAALTVSRTAAAYATREDEAERAQALAQAERTARQEAARTAGRRIMTGVRIAVRDARLEANRLIRALDGLPQTPVTFLTNRQSDGQDAPGEAAPSGGVIFAPSRP